MISKELELGIERAEQSIKEVASELMAFCGKFAVEAAACKGVYNLKNYGISRSKERVLCNIVESYQLRMAAYRRDGVIIKNDNVVPADIEYKKVSAIYYELGEEYKAVRQSLEGIEAAIAEVINTNINREIGRSVTYTGEGISGKCINEYKAELRTKAKELRDRFLEQNEGMQFAACYALNLRVLEGLIEDYIRICDSLETLELEAGEPVIINAVERRAWRKHYKRGLLVKDCIEYALDLVADEHKRFLDAYIALLNKTGYKPLKRVFEPIIHKIPAGEAVYTENFTNGLSWYFAQEYAIMVQTMLTNCDNVKFEGEQSVTNLADGGVMCESEIEELYRVLQEVVMRTVHILDALNQLFGEDIYSEVIGAKQRLKDYYSRVYVIIQLYMDSPKLFSTFWHTKSMDGITIDYVQMFKDMISKN